MLISTSFLLFILGIKSVVSEIWEPSGSKREEVCQTQECLARGKEYFGHLDSSVHPCKDFYSFVCGAWHTKHKPPAFIHEWSVRDVVEQNLLKEIRDILDQPVTPETDKVVAFVKQYYEYCKKTPSYGRYSPSEIKTQIQIIGRAENKKIWDIHQSYFKLTGESAFFDYEILATDSKSYIPTILFREMNSPYGAIKLKEWSSEKESNYFKFLYELSKALKFPDKLSIQKSQIQDVITFRRSLNEIVHQYKESGIKRTMTIADFLNWYNEIGKRSRNPENAAIPWGHVIKIIFPNISKKMLSRPIIALSESTYFEKLHSLLSQAKETTIVNHMELYFVERHLQYTDVMNDFLEKVITNPIDSVRADASGWEKCIQSSNLWDEIRRILLKKNKSLKEPVIDIIDGLKQIIVNKVKQSSWLDVQTKQSTISKVQSIRPTIGESSPLRVSTTADVTVNDPLVVSAHLKLFNYDLYISPPLLSPSIIFNPNLPKVYNYGAIGFILSHEIYHVFYECGVKFDQNMQPQFWFSQKMREECEKKMKCFSKSYKRTVTRELSERYHIAPEVDTERTVGEDYADVMGLDAAYLLYKEGENSKDVCKTLPQFEKYSCDQMFFISFANTFCGKLTPAAAEALVREEIHSIDSVRVNGAVENNEYFHQAFGCPKETPMNPTGKCNLLK